ncbi:glycosyl transferase family 2 [Fontibacillus phaseoli]|uniref:4,4'-diaponeurosporenoate glycosyltransferase n=1 Tax=Fontibacillus phaseoli TaxID=1416533 RepID=A0A369BDX0_9BACL|nr:glycosyltransferase [Fontibacillus phaseoli]RCX19762.1 glycosyl transferase family 2 [Fontibacillus phaseoli]
MIRKRKNHVRPYRKKIARKKIVKRLTNHPDPLVSIIIPAMNEKTTLPAVLREAGRVHPRSETIVVANGSTDGTPKIAAKRGAKVIHSADPLGHDVGRSLGAQAAKGRVLLFIDADMVIPAKELRPFVEAVLTGTDVALNGYSGPVDRWDTHPVVVAKHVLNAWLARPDLQGASMTAVPHALSRRALDEVGPAALEVPPLAQAMAVVRGMKVRTAHTVSVGKLNPLRQKKGRTDLLASLVAGDHLQAVHWLIRERGPRGGYEDLGRLRDKVR